VRPSENNIFVAVVVGGYNAGIQGSVVIGKKICVNKTYLKCRKVERLF